jgi:hypothetical protein
MVDYFQLSNTERLALTFEQLEEYVRAHCLREGVAEPILPRLKAEKEIELKQKIVWKVQMKTSGWATQDFGYFETAEDARVVQKLACVTPDYDTSVGYDYRYPVKGEVTVTQETLYERDSIEDARSVLEENKLIREHNESENKRYKDEQDAWAAARQVIVRDRVELDGQRSDAALVVKHSTQIAEIVQDLDKAMDLLMLQHKYEELEAAVEWFPDDPILRHATAPRTEAASE